MEPTERYQLGYLVVAAVGLGHAVETWPPAPTAALFITGAVVAFLAEATVVGLGLLRHHIEPQVLGIPVSVVVVWPAVVYVCLRLALVVAPSGPTAAVLAAVVGTVTNLVLDPLGVAHGVWTYPEHPLSRPRVNGVPWWSFAGWVVIVSATAAVPLAVGV